MQITNLQTKRSEFLCQISNQISHHTPDRKSFLPKCKMKSNHNFNRIQISESLKVLLDENTIHQTITPKRLHQHWNTRRHACNHCPLEMVLHNITLGGTACTIPARNDYMQADITETCDLLKSQIINHK